MATEPPSVTPTEPPAQPPAAADMIARIKAILIDPAAEWGRIDDEQTSVRAIMAGWVAPLAAIGPVAMLVRSLAFGFSVFGFTYWPSITEAVSQAISSYVMSLIGIFVLALIIDALAPSFGGTRDRVQALKVAAYGATAAWLAAVVNLLPGLGLLTLAGLYSLYLYYLGLPRLMRAPADKAPAYAGATIVAAVLLFLAVGWVVGAASASLFPRTISDGAVTGSLNVPGVGTFDANKVNDAAKRVQTLAQEMQAQQAAGHAAAGVTAPETLAAMLPAAIGGWSRASTESASGAVGGVGTSHAEGTYKQGDQEFRLTITDTSTMGAIGGFAAGLDVKSSRQDENGYEKTGAVDGRLTTERWNKSGDGTYSVMFGNRFLVEAQGQAPDISGLKAAVAAVDTAKLEAMAK